MSSALWTYLTHIISVFLHFSLGVFALLLLSCPILYLIHSKVPASRWYPIHINTEAYVWVSEVDEEKEKGVSFQTNQWEPRI